MRKKVKIELPRHVAPARKPTRPGKVCSGAASKPKKRNFHQGLSAPALGPREAERAADDGICGC